MIPSVRFGAHRRSLVPKPDVADKGPTRCGSHSAPLGVKSIRGRQLRIDVEKEARNRNRVATVAGMRPALHWSVRQRQPDAFFRSKEQQLYAAHNFKAILKAGFEVVECLARLQCPMGNPAHDTDKIPRGVLEFRNDGPEMILAFAQRHKSRPHSSNEDRVAKAVRGALGRPQGSPCKDKRAALASKRSHAAVSPAVPP
jgi:hypothetical protein